MSMDLPYMPGNELGMVAVAEVGKLSLAPLICNPADFGKSREVHFNRANAALDNALKSDAQFATMMDDLIPGVQSSVSSVGGRAKPLNWTWEHASSSTANGQFGVMRLVPTAQHTPGSSFWRVLHPDAGAAGGYSEWAIPAGAPKN